MLILEEVKCWGDMLNFFDEVGLYLWELWYGFWCVSDVVEFNFVDDKFKKSFGMSYLMIGVIFKFFIV